MLWHPDVPELEIKKPTEILQFEELSPEILEAMSTMEIHARIDRAAEAVAREYKKEKDESYDECVNIVSIALSVTGNAIGGKVGALMVGRSDSSAIQASRLVYPEESPIDKDL